MYSPIFIKIIVLILLLAGLSAYSQNVNDQKFRLAESFEQNGDLQGALRLYSELMQDEPKVEVFFDGYVRVMKALNNYGDLLKVVRERLPANESLEMLDLYAELCWRTGNPDESNKTWTKILSKFESSINTYFTVSQTQINLRLFEKAISTLKLGKSYFKNNYGFSDPLIKLYIAIGDYRSGTGEIFSLLSYDYNLPQAQGRLFALMINDEAREYIGDELKRLSSGNSDNIIYQEAFSWYLRTTGKLADALDLIVKIDKLKNSNGLEILNFANSTSRDGDYETAIKAFNKIIEMGKKNPYSPSALFGLTRTMEEKMRVEKGKINKKEIQEIVDSYEKIISDYPKTANSADSRIRLAEIYETYYMDYDKAINELEKLISEFPRSQYSVAAYIELGSIFLQKDELEDAEKSFNKVNELIRFASPEQKDKVKYHQALIIYFSGNIEKSKTVFESLSLNPDTDIANDVLQKLFLIKSGEQYVAALQLYAKAEFREYQKNYSEAIKILDEVSSLAESTPLSEQALQKAAEIEYRTGKYSSSREFLIKLSQKFPASRQADKYTMMTADSYFAEENNGEALKFYTELITKYPESIYLQEARKKIRIIRKDKI